MKISGIGWRGETGMPNDQILYALTKRGTIVETGSLTSCALEFGKRKYGFGDSVLAVKRIKIIELEEVPQAEIDKCIDDTYCPAEE
jgi:hypothetical protein